MVIHDLKNPTSQIKFAIDQINSLFKKYKSKKDYLEEKSFFFANKLMSNLKNIIHQLLKRGDELCAKIVS